MTNQEKLDLQWKVRHYLGQRQYGNGKSDAEIVKELELQGFQKATIKNYIKAFRD